MYVLSSSPGGGTGAKSAVSDRRRRQTRATVNSLPTTLCVGGPVINMVRNCHLIISCEQLYMSHVKKNFDAVWHNIYALHSYIWYCLKPARPNEIWPCAEEANLSITQLYSAQPETVMASVCPASLRQ